jgi:hypothetical protein
MSHEVNPFVLQVNSRSCKWPRGIQLSFTKDIEQLHDIWSRYHDDLSCPQYDEKPTFLPEELPTNFGPRRGPGSVENHQI